MESTIKLDLFGAELLKCAAAQTGPNPLKSATGCRPARSRAPGGPSIIRSLLLSRPSKAAKAGARRASANRSSLRGGLRAAKEGGYRPLRKKVMAPPRTHTAPRMRHKKHRPLKFGAREHHVRPLSAF